MYKITCIIHSLGIGGMERVMSILLNDFVQREHIEVTLLLIGRDRVVEFDLDKNIKIFRPKFTFDHTKRNWSTLKTMWFIRTNIQRIQPDCILSFGEMWNNLVLMSLKGKKNKVYISDRSQPNKNLGRLHNTLRNQLYPNASGFIAQTSQAETIAKNNNWNKNIAIIGNPIRVLDLPDVEKENLVLTVGRLIPTKNVDQLINIFSNINNQDWQLQVVGGNAKQLNLLGQYITQVKILGKTEQIKLLGQQKDVEYYLAKSKIFAFMSTSEGFPNALGEAMAAGCACIAYDCVAGPSDMIDDGENGFLIPIGNKDLFQQKLKILMQNQVLREEFSLKAKEKMKIFQADKIALEFYKTITL
ncbi:galactosyltransferase [Psychroflexus torquis ATCC 700755]|uniref:Galactosyltransferase n=1 Tax=Psychroflexus torquis (strain ATCC 700755 / CIP 106069 / ACAM 623) TaxID=313595 RepID=K4ID54_PSYTT|nr:glycosyltransferase [Psychroflexus torquis]AFU68487.1 galactosyltransferase [Psychroflexus torquis ATCC 700755]